MADLSDPLLGIASSSNLIWIDGDAAGYGWQTGAGSEGMNQLHVVTHEFGHKLGLDHDISYEVMGATLAPVLTADPAVTLALPAASNSRSGRTVVVQEPPLPGSRNTSKAASPSRLVDAWPLGDHDQLFTQLADHRIEMREVSESERVDASAEALWELEHEADSKHVLEEELLDSLVL